MPALDDARVAVYIDFDNIVISRYDQVHRRGDWGRDSPRGHTMGEGPIGRRLAAARVDVGAVLDYASSFGSIVASRAYADWSAPANASYQRQLVDRAVDLTQLFPVTAAMKNGADIRLAVDVVEDLFRLPDLSHVVIVAGDSDYIALAQRARRLGRYVVGIGVAGSTSRALMAACDEFVDYDDLLEAQADDVGDGAEDVEDGAEDLDGGGATPSSSAEQRPAGRGRADRPGGQDGDRTNGSNQAEAGDDGQRVGKGAQRRATQLLMRAMRLVHAKHPDDEWLSYGEVKSQMLRMDPAFTEKPLGHGSFGDFVAARPSVVEVSTGERGESRIRLRPGH